MNICRINYRVLTFPLGEYEIGVDHSCDDCVMLLLFVDMLENRCFFQKWNYIFFFLGWWLVNEKG